MLEVMVRDLTPVTRPSLLLRVRNPDDVEGWRQFESAYGDLIIRYCRRRGLQFADSEDIRQIVLAKLARALRRFEYDPAQGRFRDYLGQCVRHAIATEMSRHRSVEPTVSLHGGYDVDQPAGENGDADWQDEWVQHHYRRALRVLRETCDEQTLAVFDALIRGQTPEQIASVFGTSAVSVRKIKQRMRERLQQLILRQIQDESESSASP
jgi:RNA polymerase sigma factor (sigma-70 family)